MRSLLITSAVVAFALTSAVAGAHPAAHPSHRFDIGMVEPPQLSDEAPLAFERMLADGTSYIRTTISWYGVTPRTRPPVWDPADPGDPHYDWSAADARVRELVGAGLTPIVAVNDDPPWARYDPSVGTSPPDPADFAAFMHAAALRYSGMYDGLPRVRYWMIWIEPNLSPFFTPQFDPTTKQFVSPDRYRALVNAAYSAIHSAVSSDDVVAGATAPFADITTPVATVDPDWGPLKFTRRVFCLSDDEPLVATCSTPIHFDIWSTHPYASGGPNHRAARPYDVSLGDLPRWRATIDAAVRLEHVISDNGPVRYWVDEFSWDSNPPDPCAPADALLAHWIPEAFYRMWAAGIDMVAWLQLEDDPLATSWFQSGLYLNAPSFAAARPKPFIEAFRFPMVALRAGPRLVSIWARTPLARPETVTVEQRLGSRTSAVGSFRADKYGIVQARLRIAPRGAFLAVAPGGERSLPYAIKEPPDRFFNAFGQATLLEPSNAPRCIQPRSAGSP